MGIKKEYDEYNLPILTDLLLLLIIIYYAGIINKWKKEFVKELLWDDKILIVRDFNITINYFTVKRKKRRKV